ncbi:MAG: hypothetical protein PUP46_10025 [Endozoicomonas sp. (ex Botrylloides leachii)]|nr:hypothetical protein [Endozoicomonas sp. (ex Botrylloides leachii)]
MKMNPCPCCKGRAYFADIQVGGLKMWQVTCEQCGLSTEYDDDKFFCRDRWNLRQENSSLKMWVTTLAILLPFFSITCFLFGYLAGASLWK